MGSCGRGDAAGQRDRRPPRGLASVSCTAVGTCVAVGYYKSNETGDLIRGLIVTESGGVWGTPFQAPVYPSEFTLNPGDGLGSVSCSSAGNCAAGGFYNDTTSSGQPMVVSETDGQWGTPIELPQPSGSFGDPSANLVKVACTSQGNCIAATAYLLSEGPVDYRVMISTETAGSWGSAVQLQLPPNANATVGQQVAHLNSVTCVSAGNCVVAGDYMTGTESHPWVATEAVGVWQQAAEVSLPADANTASPSYAAEDSLTSVSCPSAGNCVAAGWYKYASGTCASCTQAITVTETAGAWGTPVALGLPATAISSNQSSTLQGIACTGPGLCTAVGSFTDEYDTATHRASTAAMAATSVPSLSVSTASLPGGKTGSAYTAQLSAAGGVGPYTWSTSAGSLPAGLKLNPATGAITGTPTAVGTSSFTVAVADPGPPSQHATAALSIAVAAPEPQSTVAAPNPQSMTATVGNQKITLTEPPQSPCLAKTGTLSVMLASAKIKGSPKLMFASARLYIDKGRKRTVTKTVRAKNGHKRRVRVTSYVANATIRRLPATVRLSLSGQRAGLHTLSATLSYMEKVRRHGRSVTVAVTKTLRVKFTVC